MPENVTFWGPSNIRGPPMGLKIKIVTKFNIHLEISLQRSQKPRATQIWPSWSTWELGKNARKWHKIHISDHKTFFLEWIFGKTERNARRYDPKVSKKVYFRFNVQKKSRRTDGYFKIKLNRSWEWRHIENIIFLQNRVMLITVGKLSSRWFRITIETGSENDVTRSYLWFWKVTWPCKKWDTVSREPFIIRKLFYTLNALESAGSIKCFIHFIAKKWVERPQKR